MIMSITLSSLKYKMIINVKKKRKDVSIIHVRIWSRGKKHVEMRKQATKMEKAKKRGQYGLKQSLKQKKTLYPRLVMEGSHLGCTFCKKVGSLGPEKSAGMKLAKEWVTCSKAFRKKVFEHSQTKAHVAALSILEKAKEDSLQKTIINNLSDEGKARQVYLNNSKRLLLGLMLDEATSLSRKSALIIYVRFQLPDMESPENIFVELVELEDQSAQGIVDKLLRALEGVFLSKTLIGLSCDGASVMLGRKSGVAARLKSLFLNMMVIFMDKLYTLYSTSNKNRMELKKCADELDIHLCRIVRVLDNRWIAASFRSVEAAWKHYPALYNHFSQAAEDSSRDTVTRASYSGLAKRLSSYSFVQNLGLMYDALQELSELYLEEEKGMDHKVFFRSLMRSLENSGLKDLLTAVTTVPISSAECERSFSQMNLICSANRSSLHASTISLLLFLCLVGPPLSQFNPFPYVRSWISKGHRTANDSRSKARSRKT
uniref:HAT C-terminal dimerisation domain-containing protein n=1 Tax=Sinocyclocheilus grahami TaxID=75366 RepID=A0A672PR30_SINGR